MRKTRFAPISTNFLAQCGPIHFDQPVTTYAASASIVPPSVETNSSRTSFERKKSQPRTAYCPEGKSETNFRKVESSPDSDQSSKSTKRIRLSGFSNARTRSNPYKEPPATLERRSPVRTILEFSVTTATFAGTPASSANATHLRIASKGTDTAFQESSPPQSRTGTTSVRSGSKPESKSKSGPKTR